MKLGAGRLFGWHSTRPTPIPGYRRKNSGVPAAPPIQSCLPRDSGSFPAAAMREEWLDTRRGLSRCGVDSRAAPRVFTREIL